MKYIKILIMCSAMVAFITTTVLASTDVGWHYKEDVLDSLMTNTDLIAKRVTASMGHTTEEDFLYNTASFGEDAIKAIGDLEKEIEDMKNKTASFCFEVPNHLMGR